MWHHKAHSMHQELVDARAAIAAQLNKMYFPAYAGGAAGPPDFREQIAELESQMREIDALLNDGAEPNVQE